LFREGGGDFCQGDGFNRERRSQVGREIMRSTYFAFAGTLGHDSDMRKDMEVVLQMDILRHHGLSKFGEKNAIPPDRPITPAGQVAAEEVDRIGLLLFRL